MDVERTGEDWKRVLDAFWDFFVFVFFVDVFLVDVRALDVMQALS